MANELNRRDFIKAAAIAAGPAVITARGANEKINIGWIGVGTRGDYGIRWLHTAAPDDVHLAAICDTCRALDRPRHRQRQEDLGQHARRLQGLPRAAGRQEHRCGVHHDARAPAPQHGHRRAQRGQARLPRETAGPHHRRGLGHRQGVGEIRQDLPGGDAESQFHALQEGQGVDRPGHDRRGALCARVLVPELGSQRTGLAVCDPPGRHRAEHRLEPVPRAGPEAAVGSSAGTSSGGCIGIIRAASPPTCWSTRPTSSTSW